MEPKNPPPVSAPPPQQTRRTNGGPGVRLKHKGLKPHVLHDGTLLVPGEVTEVPAQTVADLKAAKFGKTGKSSYDVLLASGFEETSEGGDTRGGDAGDVIQPPATSHLETEEVRLPENPQSDDPKWQSGFVQPLPHHQKPEDEKPNPKGAHSRK